MPATIVQLRESRPAGFVRVLVKQETGSFREVYRDVDYKGAAQYVVAKYGYSEADLLALHRPYKNDLEKLQDGNDAENLRVETAVSAPAIVSDDANEPKKIVVWEEYLKHITVAIDIHVGGDDDELVYWEIKKLDGSDARLVGVMSEHVPLMLALYEGKTRMADIICHQWELMHGENPLKTPVFVFEIEVAKNGEILILTGDEHTPKMPLSVMKKPEPVVLKYLDTNGHGGYKLGERIDLTDISKNEGMSKYTFEYWQDIAELAASSRNRYSEIRDAIDGRVATAGIQPKIKILATLFEMEGYARERECGCCGESAHYTIVGDVLVAKNQCKYPGGLPNYDVKLSVPSGKIVFANDLRELVMVEDNYDVNASIGTMLLTQAYEAQGMVHVFVGNSCPSVYWVDGKLVIASLSDETTENMVKRGNICTDLWWFSAMDYDHVVAQCEVLKIDPKDVIGFVVNVDPGEYSFTVISDDTRETYGAVLGITTQEYDTFYSVGQRTGDVVQPPMQTKNGSDDSTDLLSSHFWKTIERYREYCGTRDAAMGDIFSVLGNGFAWHRTCLRNVSGHSEDAPFRKKLVAVENPRSTDFIPVLPNFKIGMRQKAPYLYPMSLDYSKPGKTPLDANIFWLAGGMLFLKSVIECGEYVLIGDHKPPKDESEAEGRKRRRAEHDATIIASLDVLCELAEHRGIIADGTLGAAFASIIEHWED